MLIKTVFVVSTLGCGIAFDCHFVGTTIALAVLAVVCLIAME